MTSWLYFRQKRHTSCYTCKFPLFLKDDYLDLESLKKAASDLVTPGTTNNAWFNYFTCNHAPPPPPHTHTHWAFAIFSFSEVYSPPQGTQEETIPHPQAPDRPRIQFFQHLFHLYKSKTTHFHNFYERFPAEFIERKIMDVIM